MSKRQTRLVQIVDYELLVKIKQLVDDDRETQIVCHSLENQIGPFKYKQKRRLVK